ncbi:MAG: hypothetical protein EPN82_05460 [Bacteroidetes bacterium]|nr:MAG: hypothetical protein EPN82_05460 [Bacteroidota bacterium]
MRNLIYICLAISLIIVNNTDCYPQFVDFPTYYDWGRNRIDMPRFPAGPYESDDGYPVILFINNYFDDVIIYGYRIISEINGSAFEFDKNAFNNVVVHPQDGILVPVKFHPKKPGPHLLILELINSEFINARYTLKGTGIVPKVITSDVDFGSTILQDYNNPNSRKVRFTNPNSSEWEYGDTLTINNFTIKPIGNEIGISTNWGTEGFRYQKSSLNLPVKLAQGEYLEFVAEFVADKVPQSSASLISASNADTEAVSNWTGYGIVQGIRVTAGEVSTCYNTPLVIKCIVYNTGSDDLTVDSLKIQPLDSQSVGVFEFVSPNDSLGFQLVANEFKEIEISYNPKKPSQGNIPSITTHKANLVVYNNTIFTPIVLSETPLIGNAMHQYVTTRLELSRDSVTIGDTVDAKIILLPGEDLANHNIDTMDITLKYNTGFLKFLRDEIRLDGILKDRFITDSVNVSDSTGEVQISLSSKTDLYNFPEGGELLKFKFLTVTPLDTYTVAFIQHDMIHHLCLCLDKICENPEPVRLVNYNSVIKIISLNNKDFDVKDIIPNPVLSGFFKLVFRIGQTGTTEIKIYNSFGQLSAYSMIENLIPGVYSIIIDVSNLPIGAYWCDLLSGSYHETKMFIVK